MANENQSQNETQEYNADVSLPDMDLFTSANGEEEGKDSEIETEAAETEQQPEPRENEGMAKEPQIPENVLRAMEDIQRRDIELRQREQQIKSEYAAARELNELKEAIKKDPLRAIQRMGGDPTAAMEALLGPDPQQQEIASNPVIKRLMTEIESLKKNTETYKEQIQREAQQAQQVRIFEKYEQFAKSVNDEEHPLVKAFSDNYAPNTMYERAVEYAQRYNTVPTPQQVAKETEEILDKQAMDLIARLRSVPKYAKHFAKEGGEGQQEPARTRTSPPKDGKTLRNKDTAEPPPRAKESIDWSKASANDIIERTLAVGDLFDR